MNEERASRTMAVAAIVLSVLSIISIPLGRWFGEWLTCHEHDPDNVSGLCPTHHEAKVVSAPRTCQRGDCSEI